MIGYVTVLHITWGPEARQRPVRNTLRMSGETRIHIEPIKKLLNWEMFIHYDSAHSSHRTIAHNDWLPGTAWEGSYSALLISTPSS